MVFLDIKQDKSTRHVSGSRAIIGRSSQSDIQVKIAADISRVHCAIEAESGGRWAVEDYSRNGTFINGIRVRGRGYLGDGDELRLGNHLQIQFRLGVQNRPQERQMPAFQQLQSDVEPRSFGMLDTRSETAVANRASQDFAAAARRSLAGALRSDLEKEKDDAWYV